MSNRLRPRPVYRRDHHSLVLLDLLGVGRCAYCLCPRSAHERSDGRKPGGCSKCPACRRYSPQGPW